MPYVKVTEVNGSDPVLRIRTTGFSHTGFKRDSNLSSLGARMSITSTSWAMLAGP